MIMMRKICAILLLLVSPFLWAAEYNTYNIDGVQVLTIEGEIGWDEDKKIDDYLTGGPHSPQLVILNSEGGSVFAAVRIANKLNRRNSYIMVGNICLSACVHIFGGGTSLHRRYAMEYSVFSFHAATISGNISPAGTVLSINYMKTFMAPMWVQQHDYMFKKRKFTTFTASDMIANGSGLIRDENLVQSVDQVVDDILDNEEDIIKRILFKATIKYDSVPIKEKKEDIIPLVPRTPLYVKEVRP